MALTKASLIDLNSNELVLDLDADTSITADTDDTIHFKIAGSDEITMTAGAIAPSTSDGNALGTTSLMFSDLFLASGSVINFNNGDVTLTHGSNVLTLDGGSLDLDGEDLILDADGDTKIIGSTDDRIEFSIAGTSVGNFTNSSSNFVITSGVQDADIIFKGYDASSLITPLTLDMSDAGALLLTGGKIDLKNAGTASQILFYCESNNAHAQTVIGAPHSEGANNVLTLPGTGGDARLVSTTSTATLTNKTLTTPIIAEIDSGSTITLDATTDIVLDADGGDIFFKDGGTTFGSATNTSGNLIIKSGTTTALTFSGANVTISGTATTTGVHTFTAIPVFPNDTIETADIQADAITGAKIADDQIDSEHYVDGSIDTAHIAADAVTAVKLNNDVISGHDALAAIPVGTDELLISDAGTIKRIDASFFQNTPMFSVYRSTAQSLSSATTTKIQFNNTLYDTYSTWDGTDYRFVAPSSGYYSFQSSLGFQGTITRVILFFYKNGSEYQRAVDLNITGSTIVNGSCEMYLDADGYCEVFGYVAGSSNDVRNQAETWFSGSKLIGV
jgi:hypothetical protein